MKKLKTILTLMIVVTLLVVVVGCGPTEKQIGRAHV